VTGTDEDNTEIDSRMLVSVLLWEERGPAFVYDKSWKIGAKIIAFWLSSEIYLGQY
jgi:hypothetical protein